VRNLAKVSTPLPGVPNKTAPLHGAFLFDPPAAIEPEVAKQQVRKPRHSMANRRFYLPLPGVPKQKHHHKIVFAAFLTNVEDFAL
jgi:hypothetical protein